MHTTKSRNEEENGLAIEPMANGKQVTQGEPKGYLEAIAAIKKHMDWLTKKRRPTQEIASKILEKIEDTQDYRAVFELLKYLCDALINMGFTPHGENLDNISWEWFGPDRNAKSEKYNQNENWIPGTPASLKWVIPEERPSDFRGIIEFMAFLNARWIRAKSNSNTSTIARAFFPNACKKAMEKWLREEVYQCLWDIGYTPEGEEDDPVWFMDGEFRCLTYFGEDQNN